MNIKVNIWTKDIFFRDYCTSGRHVVSMCMNVIKVSVYLQVLQLPLTSFLFFFIMDKRQQSTKKAKIMKYFFDIFYIIHTKAQMKDFRIE